MTNEHKPSNLAALLRSNQHLRRIAIIVVVCSVFYHLPFFAGLVGWNTLQDALGRLHEFYGLVFFAPVVYAAYVFGIKGATLTAFAAILVLLPYATSTTPYLEGLLRATAFGVILSAVGAAVALIQKGDDKHRDSLQELRHLYDIGKMADAADSPDEFLSSVVRIVEQAVHCPEPRIRIEVGDRVAETADFATEGLSSVITLPLRSKGIAPGALKVGCAPRYRFSAEELDLLESIADEVAIDIANAGLHEETAQNLERLALIGETSRIMASGHDINEVYQAFTAAIAQLIDFDEASIHLVEGSGKRMKVLALSPSLPVGSQASAAFDVAATGTEWVTLTGKPHVERDILRDACFASDKHLIAHGHRSIVRLPLIAKGKVFGTFSLRSTNPDAYSEKDVKLLEHLVGQLAVAIENAALLSCVETQEKQFERTYSALEAVQDHMAQSEKRIELLTKTTANMVGDFNNVLCAMMSRIREAMDERPDANVQESLKTIERSALDAVNAIRRLHQSARGQLGAGSPTTNVNTLVQEAIQMEKLRRLERGDDGGDGVDYALACQNTPPSRENEMETREAVLNILVNAMNGAPRALTPEASTEKITDENEGAPLATQPVAMADMAGNIIRVNASFLKLWGYESESEVLGRTIQEFWQPDYDEAPAETVADEAELHTEATATRKDGTTFNVQVCAAMVSETAKPVCTRVSFVDVTKRKQTERDIKGSFERLRQALEETVSVLTSAMERTYPRIGVHQRRVARLASAMAREMELTDSQVNEVCVAAALHDIGKMKMPPEILDEPADHLTGLQTAVLKTHPQAGHDMVGMLPFNGSVAQAILQHHELLDGSGYPSGLSGEDILLEARILTVADVVESLAFASPDQSDGGIGDALRQISRDKGVRYDRHAVDACLRLFIEKGFTFERTLTDGGELPRS